MLQYNFSCCISPSYLQQDNGRGATDTSKGTDKVNVFSLWLNARVRHASGILASSQLAISIFDEPRDACITSAGLASHSSLHERDQFFPHSHILVIRRS